MSDLDLQKALYAAVHSQYGIAVSTDDPVALRRKLYAVRKTDEDFAELSIVESRTNPKTELWIIKVKPNV